MKIYLASQSPRRRTLLEQMGIDFEVLAVDTPEVVQPGETAEAYSLRVTQEKLVAAKDKLLQENLPKRPILCADTEVVLDEVILGKPQDEQEAYQMLHKLSNRRHRVITSVGLQYKNYQDLRTNTTWVTFGNIPEEALIYYLKTKNYIGKSGGYGIQSYIGQFISHIDGCFYSVMGLPLYTVRELITDLVKL